MSCTVHVCFWPKADIVKTHGLSLVGFILLERILLPKQCNFCESLGMGHRGQCRRETVHLPIGTAPRQLHRANRDGLEMGTAKCAARHLQAFRLDEFCIFFCLLVWPWSFSTGKGVLNSLETLSALAVTISFGHLREADMGLEIWREITTVYNGRAIKGSFQFLDGVVTVRTLHGSKAAQVRGQTPEQLARTLLRELARDGMA